MNNAETANEIVRRELEAYYVSPRDGAAPFDIRAAIAAALDAKDREKDEAALTSTIESDARALRAYVEGSGAVPKGHILTDDGRVICGGWQDGPNGTKWFCYHPHDPSNIAATQARAAAESSTPSPNGAAK